MIPIYVILNEINQNTLESATMNFMFITVLCAFFALAYSEAEFQTTNSSNITGKTSPAKLSKLLVQLNTFSGKLSKYLCLLYEKSNYDYIGTGYLVTLKTLITPTDNFKKVIEGFHFKTNHKLGLNTHEIGFHRPYVGPLSVARFDPPIEEEYKDLISRIPIFPREYLPATELPYMTIGFTKKTLAFAVKKVESTKPCFNFWFTRMIKIYLDSQYYPRLGDVLVTNGYLLGMLTGFGIHGEQIASEFYYFSYPPNTYIDALESASTSTS